MKPSLNITKESMLLYFLIVTVKHMRELKTNVLLIFRFFSNIMVVEYGICNHNFRKEIALLVQKVKAGKTMIKESYSVR